MHLKKGYLKFFLIIITMYMISGCSLLLTEKYSLNKYPPWAFPETDNFRFIMSDELKNQLTQGTPDKKEYIIHCKFNEEINYFTSINLHGYTSLKYNRRSFELKMRKTDSLKFFGKYYNEFFLISMDHDMGYINHLFAYTMLKKLNLFIPDFYLAELIINTETQGMYLFVEKTKEAAARCIPYIEIVLRRGMLMRYETKFYREHITSIPFSDYLEAYLSIYVKERQYSGAALYRELEKIMNIKRYMIWLAYNTFVKNGDYTDEVFFLGRPVIEENILSGIYFDISAWDYDDLFQEPHKGNGIPGSLVYCNENVLDVTIAEDPYLYVKFQEYFLYMLENLITSNYIEVVFDNAILALEKYLMRPDILAIQFNLEDKSSITWENLLDYYNERKVFLQTRRDELINVLRTNLGIIP